MSPWPLGQKRDFSLKPILQYFTEDTNNKEDWICKVSTEDDEGNTLTCDAKIKGGGDSNKGNILLFISKKAYLHSKFYLFK